MTAPLAPGSTIGIVGGGQLGRMMASAAAQLGYRAHIYAPEREAVAYETAFKHTSAAYDDRMALNGFANSVDVITFEFENVPVETLRHLSDHRPVFPCGKALEIAQDRAVEKRFAQSVGLKLPRFVEVRSPGELAAALAEVGTPAILKTAREGYDGKGQVRINDAAEASAAWEAIGGVRAVLEQMVAFDAEFSVLLARGRDGTIVTWDCPQNTHVDGILKESRVPARADLAGVMADATAMAKRLAEELGYVGVLACEFFATADGPLFNEMAPRVHNSGHWTIEGAETSQFENHIRAVCGLPFGSTALTGRSVVMDNIIGAEADNWMDWLSDPKAHLHLYGKGAWREGRKMGHVTRVERL